MRSKPLRAAMAAALLSTMLAGCAPLLREPAPAPAAPPADFPELYYREALAQGKPVFRVDPAESLIVIEVRRSGSLARLAVDEAALRAEAGFDTQPAESDIEGTRANMLEKVLEAERFPFALIRVSGADARQGDVALSVAITLHGNIRTLRVPARIDADAGGMNVSGRLSFDQTDFGITPYSLLGGAI